MIHVSIFGIALKVNKQSQNWSIYFTRYNMKVHICIQITRHLNRVVFHFKHTKVAVILLKYRYNRLSLYKQPEFYIVQNKNIEASKTDMVIKIFIANKVTYTCIK